MAKIKLKPNADPQKVKDALKKIGITMRQKVAERQYMVHVSDDALFTNFLNSQNL